MGYQRITTELQTVINGLQKGYTGVTNGLRKGYKGVTKGFHIKNCYMTVPVLSKDDSRLVTLRNSSKRVTKLLPKDHKRGYA